MLSQFQFVLKEDFGTHGRIILKRIINKHHGKMRAGFIWCRMRYLVNRAMNFQVPQKMEGSDY
jgi:hypothetical protein